MTTQSESARLTKDVFETVEINLQSLNEILYTDFKKDIFDDDVKTNVDLTRKICDVTSMKKDIKYIG